MPTNVSWLRYRACHWDTPTICMGSLLLCVMLLNSSLWISAIGDKVNIPIIIHWELIIWLVWIWKLTGIIYEKTRNNLILQNTFGTTMKTICFLPLRMFFLTEKRTEKIDYDIFRNIYFLLTHIIYFYLNMNRKF